MASTLAPVEVLERTRRGEEVDAESVEALVRSWLDGDSSDALMAAWCMAACLRGMGTGHAAAMARALVASGDRLELGSLGPVGDVASTGAVGDTVPLVAAPLAAALGVRVAVTADRGLGHTGGLIDKLEAIPGYVADLTLSQFVTQVRDTGIAVVAPTGRLAPGVARLAALRDATGTVTSVGLVAAATAAACVAGGAPAVALLVPFGGGGLLDGPDDATAAAQMTAEIAGVWGRAIRWTLVDAGRPLGHAVGTALEVAEAARVLRGEGPDDVRDLAVRLAGDLAEATGAVPEGEGRTRAAGALGDGSALATAERWVEAQEGDPAVWTDPGALPTAPLRIDVESPRDGWVTRIDAREVGETARWLGAGRLHPMQSIDPVAGLEIEVTEGERVDEGQPLAVVHAREDTAGAHARDRIEAAFVIGDAPPAGGGADA